MKIGILTFTEGTNIGQRLQNYALATVLERAGCEVFTIRQGYPFSIHKRLIKECLFVMRHPAAGMRKHMRAYKFAGFNKKWIKFYDKKLPFVGDNRWISKEFEAFITGSDQVWNPESPFVGQNFFLTFADDCQRLTYAPSFSVDQIASDKEAELSGYLQGFSMITVREDKGAELVKYLTGIEAYVVLDPTLLLNRQDYEKLKKPCTQKPNHPYILSMFLGVQPNKELMQISEQLELPILTLDSSAVIGPDEFLDLVEHAVTVLTDSYHITVFSILYKKPFVNFVRSGKGSAMHSRFDTLYRLLAIEGRTWNDLSQNISAIMKLDYVPIYERLETERRRSLEILKQELREAGMEHINEL